MSFHGPAASILMKGIESDVCKLGNKSLRPDVGADGGERKLGGSGGRNEG